MPFKSKAQRRKFAQLLMEGEITPEQFEEWNRATGSAVLPERVTPGKRVSASKVRDPRRKTTSRTKRKQRKAGKKSRK